MRRHLHLISGLLLAVSPALLAAAAPCPAVPDAPSMGVHRVIDGDTLVLADGRHVRFIGIDAMELGHDGSADQPYAAAARDRLKQLIEDHGGKLRLETDSEAYDEHGRMLAYLFAGGEDLGLTLIREGLAVVVAVPPDLAQLGCYAEAEARARASHLGIWSKDSPLVTAAADAPLGAGTFLIVHGRITRASHTRAGDHLLLDGHLPLWIPAADLSWFGSDPAGWQGRQGLVRGWLRVYRGTPELDVHAPAALLAWP